MQNEILLTLSAGSLRSLVGKPESGLPDIFAIPAFTERQLRLRGLNIPTDMMKGFGIQQLDKLRDSADRAGCPVLLLIEEKPIDFTDRTATWAETRQRLKVLGNAAAKLQCPALAVRCEAPQTDQAFELTAKGVKLVVQELDRFELNLLITPHEGLTEDPVKLTELIKKIGGFRIGSYPSFAAATKTGDADKSLRRLAPYAQAISASIQGFRAGKHIGFGLEKCVESIIAVGYTNTLAVDLVNVGPKTNVVKDIETAREMLGALTSPPEIEVEDFKALEALLEGGDEGAEAHE
ncbi:MAG: hypothetical protein EXS10_02800 [Phycisphaerales bacterium]|nr:hypothetical protein [Phycisphaerales bacterium]